MFKLFSVICIFLVSTNVLANPITIYMYHHQPPFLIGKASERKGLIYDVGTLLNRKTKNGFSFVVKPRPRSRLNFELKDWIMDQCPEKKQECDSNWMVFWVTPQWGWGPNADRRFLWVDLFNDQDVIVSLKSNKVEYEDPTSLIGKKFGSIQGHKYPPEIESLFRSGKLVRLNGDEEILVLERLFQKRVDVTMMQQSAFNYYFINDKVHSEKFQQLYIAPKPFKSFMLKVMIPGNRQDLQNFLMQVKEESEWESLFTKYQIKL